MKKVLVSAVTAIRAALIVPLVLLAACGGGGGGGSSTSISALPNQVAFQQALGGAPASDVTVRVSFTGDGVVAGFATGVSPPSWLIITASGAVASGAADFVLGVNQSGLPAAGSYASSVRFVTGRLTGSGDINDATNVSFVDVPVALIVSNFAVSPSALSYDAVGGSSAAPAGGPSQFSIAGTNLQWQASSNQPWLSLAQTSGNAAATVSFTLSTAALPLGANTADVTVRNTPTNETQTVRIVVNVRAPQLVLQPAATTIAVDAATTTQGLSRVVSVTDELSGGDPTRAVQWTIASIDQPWLSASPNSGGSAPASNVALTVSQTQLLQLANGDYTANVRFSYTNADTTNGTLVLPVSLHLNLPRFGSVAPYIAYANEAADGILRGQGLVQAQPIQVRIGGLTPTTTLVNDTDLRVRFPALAAGRYPVTVTNALGLALPSPELVVIEHAALPAATLTVANTNTPQPFANRRLIYDAERSILLALDVTDGRILRWQIQGGQWHALAPIALAGVNAMELSIDGKALLLGSGGSLFETDPNSAAAPLLYYSLPNGAPEPFIRNIAMTDRNVAIVSVGIQGNAGGGFVGYDMATHAIVPQSGTSFISSAAVYAGADGRQVNIALSGISPPAAPAIYTSSTGVVSFVSPAPVDLQNTGFFSVSRNASRSINNLHGVFDEALNQLGRVAGTLATVVSPDGQLAYTFSGASSVSVSDLTAAIPPGGTYPVTRTLVLPAGTLQNEPVIAMTLTLDGRFLFVSDSQHIVVVSTE